MTGVRFYSSIEPAGSLGAETESPSDPFPRGVCAQQQLPRAGDPGEAGQGQSAHGEG
jgi:hypothetical protein